MQGIPKKCFACYERTHAEALGPGDPQLGFLDLPLLPPIIHSYSLETTPFSRKKGSGNSVHVELSPAPGSWSRQSHCRFVKRPNHPLYLTKTTPTGTLYASLSVLCTEVLSCELVISPTVLFGPSLASYKQQL